LRPVGSRWRASENTFVSTLADDYADPWPASIQRRGQGGFSLRYRVAPVGHMAQDRSLTLLEEAGGSTGQVSGAEIAYPDVFPGVTIRYRVDHDYLKQTLEISEAAKARLRQAVERGGLDPDGWLAIGVRLNVSGMAGWRLGLREDEETEGPIPIEKPAAWTHQALDHLGVATVHDESDGDPVVLKQRLVQQPGQGPLLLALVPLSWLAESQGAVTVDPTYYGQTSDGFIWGWSATYGAARSTSYSCDTGASYGYVSVGQYKKWYGYPIYNYRYIVYRSYLDFDTSGIPDNATVTSAVLYVNGDEDWSTTDFDVRVYNYSWSEPLCSSRDSNYDGAYGGGGTYEGVLVNTSSFSLGWNSMSVGTSRINKTGETKYAMTSSRDESGNQPSGIELVTFVPADEPGTGSDPYLSITYNQAPTAPSALLTEGATNPEPISDTTPEFSAVGHDPDPGDTLTHAKIHLDDDSDFSSLHWASGWMDIADFTEGNRSPDISYAGPSLTGGVRYYWRIKFRDNDGVNGTWSTETAYFRINRAPSAPTSLLTEGGTNPVTVADTPPEFSAVGTDPDPGDVLTQAQVQVDDNSNFSSPIWDSGWMNVADFTAGNRSPDISYAGPALTHGVTYYWRIRFQDDDGAAGAWSTETAYFVINSAPTAPTGLQVDGVTNPTNIEDMTPEFSAVGNDPNSPETLTHAQVQVDDDSDFGSLVWDSGWLDVADFTAGNRSPEIPYGGPALGEGQKYYWRIRFRDDGGIDGAWSTESAWFTTYVLQLSDAATWSFASDDVILLANSGPDHWTHGDATYLHMVYMGNDGVRYTRGQDGNLDHSQDKLLEPYNVGADGAEVSIFADGANIHAVWAQYDIGQVCSDTLCDVQYRRNTDSGQTNSWQPVVNDVSGDFNGAYVRPMVVADGANVVIVWSDGKDIYSALSTDGGESFVERKRFWTSADTNHLAVDIDPDNDDGYRSGYFCKGDIGSSSVVWTCQDTGLDNVSEPALDVEPQGVGANPILRLAYVPWYAGAQFLRYSEWSGSTWSSPETIVPDGIASCGFQDYRRPAIWHSDGKTVVTIDGGCLGKVNSGSNVVVLQNDETGWSYAGRLPEIKVGDVRDDYMSHVTYHSGDWYISYATAHCPWNCTDFELAVVRSLDGLDPVYVGESIGLSESGDDAYHLNYGGSLITTATTTNVGRDNNGIGYFAGFRGRLLRPLGELGYEWQRQRGPVD